MCGKNVIGNIYENPELGSPPRVREKPSFKSQTTPKIRITPACAGKTVSASLNLRLHEDHPRVCGKNLNVARDVKSELGSPPRVREKQGYK